MPSPIKSSRLLYALSLAKPALAKLAGHGKEYDPLLGILCALPAEASLPTGKYFQAHLAISPAKFRRWLEAIHDDFFALIADDATALQFPRVEHWVYVQGRREPVSFRCHLPIIPRIGEGLDLWFLLGEAGEASFYVDDVRYEFEGEVVRVQLFLRPGYFNPYAKQLRARARFEGTLPYHLEQEFDEYEVETYLRKTYPGPSVHVPPPTRGRRG